MDGSQEITTNALYTIEHFGGSEMLVHNWRMEASDNIPKFKNGVAAFADQCTKHKIVHAVFDASKLKFDDEVVQWISGRQTPEGEGPYGPWWIREIVSVYNEVGLKSLAIATGDPNATGEQAESPPGCNFAMAFFEDLKSAMNWKPK